MAIPTTQKECTTRRIAALIIGLWDKVKDAFLLKTSRGSANGVASLDANGKVPSSQLPKIGTSGIENDAITAALVKDGDTLPVNISGSAKFLRFGAATTSGNAGLYYKVLRIAANKISQSHECNAIIYFVVTVAGSIAKEVKCYIRVRNQAGQYTYNTTLLHTINEHPIAPYLCYDSASNDLYLYAKVENSGLYSGVRAYILSESDFNGENSSAINTYSFESSESSAPYNQITPTNLYYARSSSISKGGPSVPIYVDSNGVYQTCSNIPVIEHVTAIPVNPTVGTIYAL